MFKWFWTIFSLGAPDPWAFRRPSQAKAFSVKQKGRSFVFKSVYDSFFRLQPGFQDSITLMRQDSHEEGTWSGGVHLFNLIDKQSHEHDISRTESLSNDDGDGNEKGKKAIGLDWQNKCITLFSTLVKVPNLTFCRGREHKTTTFFFFSWTFIQSYRIQLQKKLPAFDELNELEWANSLFKWRFRSRRRHCCLSSLLKRLCHGCLVHWVVQ